MEENRKRLIEKIINIIPSKDLREAYIEDITNGKYPNWTRSQMFAMLRNIYNDIFDDKSINFLYDLKNIEDNDSIGISLDNCLSNYEKNNIFEIQYIRGNENFINLKALFKGGDIIKYRIKDKIYYGIVASYDYSKIHDNYSKIHYYFWDCYKAYSLDKPKEDDEYLFVTFTCHKDRTEKVSFDELTEEQIKYYNYLKKYV